MSESMSDRRLAENEVSFRHSNERVEEELRSLRKQVRTEGHGDLLGETDLPVQFYCECSNMNCRARIKLKPSQYRQLHQNRDQFVLAPGHNIPRIERIMKSEKDYLVVEKFISSPPNKT